MDPYARAQQEILPAFDSSAKALEAALMGQAGYEIGRVRNREAWQKDVLGPFEGQARSTFEGQSNAVRALGDALTSATRSLGYGLAHEVGGKMGGIQAPGAAVSAHGGAQGVTGEGAAGAISGLSSADVTMLNSLGGAYGDFAAGMPRIAGLAGDAAARDIAQAAANQYATEMAQLGTQRQAALIEAQRYYEEQDYERAQDAAKLAADAEQLAYDRNQDRQNMAYKWATLDVRQKTALLSDKRTSQRIFLEQKRLGLTAQNQTFNQWAKQQQLAISRQNAATSAGNLDLAAIRAGKPIIKGSPSTGIGIYDSMTGQQIGGYPGKGKPPKPLGTPQQLAKWRANARAMTAAGINNGDNLEAIIDVLLKDTDAGPMAVWGPVVASKFGLTPDLPNNLRKYPPIRIVQLAAKLGFQYEWESNLRSQKPTKRDVIAATNFLAQQWTRLFPKVPAARGGAQGQAALPESNILPASFKVTHRTSGAEQYGATDWMRPAGTVFGAPVGGTIYNIHGTPGSRGDGIYGYIAYLKGDNGVTYFMTHFDNVYVRNGQRVQRGTPIGTVAPYGKASHIHVGSSAV
jgi:hypothetical protein